jgi:hypothetical protein
MNHLPQLNPTYTRLKNTWLQALTDFFIRLHRKSDYAKRWRHIRELSRQSTKKPSDKATQR